MNEQNIYTVPEEYKETWDSGITHAITQKSAGLTNIATCISCDGDYHEMTSVGTLQINERTARHERLPEGQEPRFGNRRFYKNAFAAFAKLSKDDFKFKGRFPLAMNMMHDLLADAAAPYPDRCLLGVTDPKDEYRGNCLIDTATRGSTEADTSPYGGRREGLMGINWTGLNGTTPEVLPQQPLINGALATSYTQYANNLDGIDPKKSNVIPYNYALKGTPAGSGFVEEKVRGLKYFLQKRFINSWGEFCMAVTPWQMAEIEDTEKWQNKDFRDSFKVQDDGSYISSLLGLRLVVTPDVPIVNIGTESDPKWVRACPVWRKSSLIFGTWQNPEYNLFPLQETHYDSVGCTIQFAYGAGRRRVEDVLVMHCEEPELDGISIA